ncbi:MAG: NDP-sugar synthase [Deltaproteobacteria bacterium]|nr:NDP-sugar synthase [Deltaproteobacteria bacterium]
MMRALVLAAGLGTRLRPLTENLPKPLMPLLGRRLIDGAFATLAAANIDDIAVNAHHQADTLHAALADGTPFGQSVRVVDEPTILGTGGAIKNLRDFLGASDLFVVLNGDTLSRPDLAGAIERHRASGAMATLVLKRDPRSERYGAVEVDADGGVVDLAGLVGATGVDRGLFIGAQIVSPTIFEHMPSDDVFCVVRQVYRPLVETHPGRVRAVFTDGPFEDLGTPDDYAAAQFRLLAEGPAHFAEFFEDLLCVDDGFWQGDDADVSNEAMIATPVFFGAGAIVEGSAHIGPNAVVGAGAIVGDGATVRNAIVMPGVRVASGAVVENVVVGEGYEAALADAGP